MENTVSRLVDEFRAEVLARGVELPGELEINGSFADLDPWPSDGDDVEGVIERCEVDPAFKVTGYSRWVVFARVRGEIRYYAAALPVGGSTLSGPGVDLARVADAEAESDYSELAILASVADAVTLTAEYLGGAPLREIDVPRLPPPWGFPEPEPGMD